MCGRYYLDFDDEKIKNIADSIKKNTNEDFKTGEIHPSDKAPILAVQNENMKAIVAKWGFPRYNSKGLIINARVESLSEKNMFKNLSVLNRCIIPASGFFEWGKSADGRGQKNKYYFRKPNEILYLAGLYNTYNLNSRQLSLFDEDKKILSYVIITKKADEQMKGIHDRMPLMLTDSEMEKWLKGENPPTNTASHFLFQYLE